MFTSIEKWTQYSTTLNASNNTYYDSTTANPFKVVNGKMVNLSGWQSSVQSDYSSTWQSPVISPVAACAAPAPTLTDFSVNVDSNVYTMSAAKATVTARVNSFAYGPVNLQASGLPQRSDSGDQPDEHDERCCGHYTLRRSYSYDAKGSRHSLGCERIARTQRDILC